MHNQSIVLKILTNWPCLRHESTFEKNEFRAVIQINRYRGEVSMPRHAYTHTYIFVVTSYANHVKSEMHQIDENCYQTNNLETFRLFRTHFWPLNVRIRNKVVAGRAVCLIERYFVFTNTTQITFHILCKITYSSDYFFFPQSAACQHTFLW